MLEGVTAYGADGNKVTGTIPRYEGETITPGKYTLSVDAGNYLDGPIRVTGDTNLIPENIKNGVSIFDVSGTYGGSISLSNIMDINYCIIIRPEVDFTSVSIDGHDKYEEYTYTTEETNTDAVRVLGVRVIVGRKSSMDEAYTKVEESPLAYDVGIYPINFVEETYLDTSTSTGMNRMIGYTSGEWFNSFSMGMGNTNYVNVDNNIPLNYTPAHINPGMLTLLPYDDTYTPPDHDSDDPTKYFIEVYAQTSHVIIDQPWTCQYMNHPESEEYVVHYIVELYQTSVDPALFG